MTRFSDDSDGRGGPHGPIQPQINACVSLAFAGLLLLIIPRAVHAQATGPVLRGRISSMDTGEPVPGAQVILGDGVARVSTDADGQYRITGIAQGTYTVHVVRLGYAELTRTDVRIGQGETVLDLTLSAAAVNLSSIVVTPGSYSFIGRSPSPRQTMSRVDIESVPQFAEDIFRAVNRLPGLSSGDFTAHFSIRGGRHDETLILLDGLEIYEPYHLKDFNDGAVSIIDVETIEGVDLMTGGFPVRYGNRTSGVFSVTSRDPGQDDARFSLGLSLINARAMGQGSFADGRGSWFVSGRRGYLDLVLDLTNATGLPSPAYHDIFGKLNYQLSDRHRLALNVLQAGDSYTFDAAATTGYQDSIKTRERANNRYGNSYVWLTHEGALTDALHVTTIASAGLVTSTRDGTEFYLSDSVPIYAVANRRDFSVLGFKQDWRFDWSAAGSVQFGFDARALHAEYDNELIVNQNPDDPAADVTGFYPNETTSSLQRDGSQLGAYVGSRYRAAPWLTFEAGLRYDRATYSDDSDVSPRASALLLLTDRTQLRVGWGQYRQMQGIGDLALQNGQQVYFPSELSTQWTAGLEHTLNGGGTLRVEAYRKRGSDLRPVYRNWKGGLDTFPESNEDRILVHPERMLSHGIEVSHQRNLSDRLSLRASYAYSKVEETVVAIDNVNEPEPLIFDSTHGGPQDQRHAANLDLTFRWSETWSVTGSYSFHTGWPGTLETLQTVTDEDGELDYAILPDAIYGHRLPAYHRLDARLTKRTHFHGGDLRFFVEISNLTNRENVFGYDFFRSPGANGGIRLSRDVETGFTILPSIGVSWTGNF